MKGDAPRDVSNWHDLKPRLLSAVILMALAVAAIVGGGWYMLVFVSAVSIGLVIEGAEIVGFPFLTSPQRWRSMLFFLWPVTSLLIAFEGSWRLAATLMVVGGVFGLEMGLVLFCAIVGSLSLLWLRMLPEHGIWAVIFVVACVVASDSCAYLAGRVFGGAKLAVSISPGKTWSGAVGGLLGASLMGGILAEFISHGGVSMGFFWGGVLGISAQAGDLLESATKRRFGIKDSGRILPGHGGLFDRFDGLIAAAPLAALLSVFSGAMPFWQVNFHAFVCAVSAFAHAII